MNAMNTPPPHTTSSRTIGSPVGDLVILASPKGISGLYFGHRIGREELPGEGEGSQWLDAAAQQLSEFFAHDREEFDLPLDPVGTEFQMSVWKQLSLIPFGETASYRQIAERIDNPAAVRAVGLANGSNPISIIVPCHRVIGADGSLTGFGGGLDIKRQLLEFEGALLAIG